MTPIVVSIAGELDMEREIELLELVMSVDAPTGATVDVDVSEVTFVDSSGRARVMGVGRRPPSMGFEGLDPNNV
jgi:anti-anti-sigma regulatory factor